MLPHSHSNICRYNAVNKISAICLANYIFLICLKTNLIIILGPQVLIEFGKAWMSLVFQFSATALTKAQ